MVARLSTAGMQRSGIEAILDHQVQMAKTQQQITTGKKFQTASEDPIGAVRAQGLDRTLADNAQYGRNSDIIQSRLNYEEQSLADSTSLLQSVRDLALQGSNSTLGAEERRMLANDVQQHLAGLLDIANRDDSNGEYLFSGTSTSTKPFALGTTGINYQGDMTNRQVRISSSQSLADGHSGADVLMSIPPGNGVFTTSVGASNTGGGSIDVGRVADPTAWVPGNYTLQFTSTTDWQVVDDATPTPNVIATGTGFAPGQSISFNGVTVGITGQPAVNDSFGIQTAQKTDVFAMLQDLANTLGGGTSTPGDAATFSTKIGAAIANIDQALNRVVGVRAEVGSRLSAIDSATDTRDSEAVDLQSLISDLRDVDYAKAISQLNQQYTGLQAAQASYTRFAQMSLFDYLR
jgi:flagellar hook-associated protein 3 FlgL